MSAAPRLRSYDDLYAEIVALPEGSTGEILEEGVLRTMSRPGRGHRLAARHIAKALDGADGNVGGSGWWIEIEAEVRLLVTRLVVPDLAGWRVERVPELPEREPIEVVPDWACEILSPSTARDDRRLKLPLYARAGVAWCWLVDPEQRLVEVYETVNGRPTLTVTGTPGDGTALPPFDGISVGEWFLPPPSAEPPP